MVGHESELPGYGSIKKKFSVKQQTKKLKHWIRAWNQERILHAQRKYLNIWPKTILTKLFQLMLKHEHLAISRI